ncbi:hypothetical protein P7228_08005 [Altererythrobacter arenosus]|uniref:Glucosamine inositolphosphorylceramide transferase 1 N-terminal domain-containing protein n=1 Tax=Altererythrobacter arenosus TaxID=3032592 RepID=A0ABY8FLQ3_9SPHN|nr:hypothetical protein [Altererythrobacter sp. CAU 1644]WFL75954.1 hypothetical protein P7228_08005 [Altererythrobacter sp. CAU 1644]
MHEHGNPRPPLRTGILACSGQEFEAWELALFERLKRHPNLTIAGLVLLPAEARAAPPSGAFRVVSAIDGYLFDPGQKKHALTEAEALASVPRISLEALVDGESSFDILLAHSPMPPGFEPGDFGGEIWEYQFNTDPAGNPELFGFRESLGRAPLTRSAILRRREGGTHEVIASLTTNTKFSGARNAHHAKSNLPALVERELARRWQDSSSGAWSESLPSTEVSTPDSAMTSGELVRYVGHLASNLVHRLGDSMIAKVGGGPGRWSLVVSRGDVLNGGMDDLQELHQPDGEHRADPFLFEKDGHTYVFFECWRTGGAPARICVGRIQGELLVDVEELDFGGIHLSYPFVFETAEGIFMIPETHQRNRVEVWRCTEFPSRWELHATALEGLSPADSVILEWNEQHWLLTSLSSGDILDHCMELHLYRVDGPGLNFVEPHPLNPVVLDTTCARNAGRPFVRDGRLIRPAQITSHGIYGYGLVFMEVTEISMEGYAEKEIRRIEPDREKATTGCHHYDCNGDLFIMDVRRAYGSKLLGAGPIALRVS